MEVFATDPQSGKELRYTIGEPSSSFFAFMTSFELTDEQIRERIDRMSVSADVKALLYGFSTATIRAGRAIVKVGRKIIDFIFSVLREFPMITFGAVFGLVVGTLISAIPIIGVLLGSFAMPIAIGFGTVLGAKHELERADLAERVQKLIDQFAPLRA